MTEESVGYRIEPGEGGLARARDGDGGLVQLLRIRAGDEGGAAALDTLLAAEGPHVQRVLDVGTAVNGDLIAALEPAPHGLAELLAVAGWPTEAEAVTVLVPLLETVARLHAEGIAHGSLGADAVRFDDSGTPTIVGFQAAVQRVTAGGPAFEAAAAADRLALGELVTGILRRTGRRGAALAGDLTVADLGSAAAVDALFGLADPLPVRLRPIGPETAAVVPSRLVEPVPAVPAAVRRLPLSRSALRRLAGVAHRVRVRVWVALAVTAALLAAALVLLPGRGADASGAVPRVVHGSVPRPPSPTRPVAPSSPAAPMRSPAHLGEDPSPVAATIELLQARRACLAAGRIRCLATVDAAGSPAAQVDAAAMTAGVEPVAVPAARPRLASRGGGTAVLDVGNVTVLIVRQPDGWRLRDVVRGRPR